MTRLAPSPSRTRRALARRPRAARRAGFTLLEMMVALTIGAVVIATVYTLGASASRHFQEQQRIAQLQLSVRLALDRVRRDVARAGFHATMNSAIDQHCGAAPSPQIRGVSITNASPISTAALGAMAGASQGDRLELVGNFRTDDVFLVREWQGSTLQLATNFLSYRRAFLADPATGSIDPNLVAQAFAPGTAIMARLGGGQRFWTTVSSSSANTIGTYASITTNSTPNCPGVVGMEGWAQGGVTVAPVSRVVYEIANITGGYAGSAAMTELLPRNANVTGPNTVLLRTEYNPLSGAILDGPTPILEHAVHFDVDVFADVGTGTNVSTIDVFDDAAAQARTTTNPATIRGVRISLAARTPEQDGHLSSDVAALGDGTPRVFRVFGDRPGAARVRSAYTEVFLPNSSAR